MMVLVLSACPVGLRGYLSRWLLEISAGVFVGKVSRRVRELMWQRTADMMRDGRAILVYSVRNEQGLAFEVHGHHWQPIDIEGITLMLRPAPRTTGDTTVSDDGKRDTGWSKAARRRRSRRIGRERE